MESLRSLYGVFTESLQSLYRVFTEYLLKKTRFHIHLTVYSRCRIKVTSVKRYVATYGLLLLLTVGRPVRHYGELLVFRILKYAV
jgi:hypothetical protein